jgi:hypothetical protein
MGSDGEHVGGRQAGPAPVGREERADILFTGTCPGIAAAEPPPDLLEQTGVAGRELVVAALPLEREHLDRPRTDTWDRAQPALAALVVGVVQIKPPACHLARDAGEQPGARSDEAEGLQARRRDTRERPRRGDVAQTPAS